MVGMEHGDQIVELAAAQRIMHEMGARAGPQHHVRPPQVLGHVLALEHGAIGDVAGHARLAVADDALADLRPHAVAADQRAAFGALAVSSVTVTRRRGLVRPSTRRLFSSVIRLLRLAGLEKRAVDVGAMGDRIGLAEAFGESVAERNAGDQLAGERVAHFLRRRNVGVGEDRVLEADFLQHAENIGAELDAGADFAELRALLEHAHRDAVARQRVGGGQPADAAARTSETARRRHWFGHGSGPRPM